MVAIRVVVGGLAALLLVVLTEASSDAGWCCRLGGNAREVDNRKFAVVPPVSSSVLKCEAPYYPGRCDGTMWIVPCKSSMAVGCVHRDLNGTPCTDAKRPATPPGKKAVEARPDQDHTDKDHIGTTPRWLYPVARQPDGTFKRVVFYQPIDAFLPREYVTPMPTDPDEDP